MRLTVFLIISLALHTAALTYPAVFLRPPVEEPIPVTVFGLGGGTGQENGVGEAKTQEKSAPAGPKHRVPMTRVEARRGQENELPAKPQDPMKISVSQIDVPAGIAVETAGAAPAEARGGFSTSQENVNDGGARSAGWGFSGTGTGSGVGGGGKGGADEKFVQVSYAYSPRPEYPDKARKEGKEGRVILRVLVDAEGRSKSVELNRSSGTDALDRAATETIKHWRFSPARYGERPVESWVRIPIDFRLTEPSN